MFPENCKLEETLDLYFQMCSVTVTVEKLSVMGATLANGGKCPLNDKKVVSPDTVKCVLQLMYSCGMVSVHFISKIFTIFHYNFYLF